MFCSWTRWENVICCASERTGKETSQCTLLDLHGGAEISPKNDVLSLSSCFPSLLNTFCVFNYSSPSLLFFFSLPMSIISLLKFEKGGFVMIIAFIIPKLVSLILQIIVVNIQTICLNIKKKTYNFPGVNEWTVHTAALCGLTDCSCNGKQYVFSEITWVFKIWFTYLLGFYRLMAIHYLEDILRVCADFLVIKHV